MHAQESNLYISWSVGEVAERYNISLQLASKSLKTTPVNPAHRVISLNTNVKFVPLRLRRINQLSVRTFWIVLAGAHNI